MVSPVLRVPKGSCITFPKLSSCVVWSDPVMSRVFGCKCVCVSCIAAPPQALDYILLMYQTLLQSVGTAEAGSS